ncbi:MAG: L,D-transpeptidase family protein [Gammaproteobacteria bacterium]|nr:L,D-transpeptidase family protein [Gammaproteobacteria bacterium]
MKGLAFALLCAALLTSSLAHAKARPVLTGVFDGFQLPEHARADRVVVEKEKHTLTLYSRGVPLKTYKVALGKEPKGDKRYEGDNRTPEGVYTIDGRREKSQYHRALHISYPNDTDKAQARALGKKPGGQIMIHGLTAYYAVIGAVHRVRDWTQGCIAVTNPEIEEIWRAVPNGTTIEIRP